MQQDQTNPSGADRNLFEWVRQLHRDRETGALEIAVRPQRRRLYLQDGEVYLSGSHPLARMLSEHLEQLRAARRPDDPAIREIRQGLLGLVQRIVSVLSDWRLAEVRFESGPVALPADLVGPLPTLRLVMMAATLGKTAAELESQLGGSASKWVVPVPSPPFRDVLGLLPEETWILERLRVPMSLEELCRQAPLDRAQVVCSLAELAAVGSVRRESDSTAPIERPQRDSGSVVVRLLDRFDRDLQEEDWKLDPARHRQLLADLLARFGGLNHYELLGVPSRASSEEIQGAYEQLGKLVHPSHAGRLGWEDRSEALEILFEQVTRAYLTLIDPERRVAYNESALIDVSGPIKSGAEREAEQKSLAQELFQKAELYLQRGEAHFARELLQQAIRLHPVPDYWLALARLEAENPATLQRAIDAYRSALELDNDSVPARLGLAQVYEKLGDAVRARVQYSAVVRLDPGNLTARSALQRLASASANKTSGSLLDWLFRRN